MSVLLRTVYRIDDEYYPDGCDRLFACGMFIVTTSQYRMELPDVNAGTCEANPPKVFVEIVQYNGQTFYVKRNPEDIGMTQECYNDQQAGGGGGGGVITINLTDDGNLPIPEGILVEKIAMLPTISSVQQIGITAVTDEVMLSELLAAGTWKIIDTNVIGQTLYFQGIAGPQTIKIYTKSL